MSKLEVKEYFKVIYESFSATWEAVDALELLGTGRTNEGTQESKAIKRYYVTPHDKRFREIYINYDSNETVKSIVWFISNGGKLTLADLLNLFGDYHVHGVIYDETSDLIFHPKKNPAIGSVKTTIPGWIEKKSNGKLFFTKDNEELVVEDGYTITSLIISRK